MVPLTLQITVILGNQIVIFYWHIIYHSKSYKNSTLPTNKHYSQTNPKSTKFCESSDFLIFQEKPN